MTDPDQVVDPLASAPKLAGPNEANGDDVPFEDTPARSRRQPVRPSRKRKTAYTKPGPDLVLPTCPDGHPVGPDMRFCPHCGARTVTPGPLLCRNGHEVQPAQKFCSDCGIPLSEEIQAGDPRPKPDSELTPEELAERRRQHDTAVRLGNENPVVAYAPGHAPQGTQTTILHFLVDGFTAFGHVWMRGQEIELWPGHPRWKEAQAWINMDTAAQYKRWGREMFRQGPWPGERSYTAGVGQYQRLKGLDGTGEVQQPDIQTLLAADDAERRRGRRVPMPLL